MKVLIYSANFAPEPTGIGKYSGEMARWLVEQGHEVHVVAAPPYYPAWKLEKGYAWPPYRRENWHGVTVDRAPLWIPREPGGVSRIVHLLTFAITSCPVMLVQAAWRPDVVLSIAPAMVCAPTGWLTARLCGAKAWLHLQDFEVDIAFQMGLLKNGWLRKLVQGFERLLLTRFDSLSTISNRMVEKLVEKGVPPKKARLFPNWVDTRQIEPFGADGAPRRLAAYRRELGISDDAIVVLFSGTLGRKQGLSIIPEVARRLAHRSDVVFVICGDGVMKEELSNASKGLANVRMMPLQPVERLAELLCMANVHLLPQNPRAEDLVLPSKLSGMIASGRAVIATCREGTELESVVRQCGLVVPPDDVVALGEAVLRLADDANLRRQLGRRGREWAEEHVDRHAVLLRFFGPSVPEAQPVHEEPVVTTTG